MKIVIDVPEDVFKRTVFYREFRNLSDCVTILKALEKATQLPKGHGDLIDRNLALSGRGLSEFHRYDDYVKMRNYLKLLPTIIEADKAESEEVC